MIRFFATHAGKVFLNVFISIAAAVVILGALGKILHAPWGTIAITAGMLSECVIFLLLAMVPVDPHPHWDRYFPDLYKDTHKEKKTKKELGFQKVNFLAGGSVEATPLLVSETPVEADKAEKKEVPEKTEATLSGPNPALNHLDDMLQQADITPKNLKKLSENFAKLNTTVAQVADISASNAYIKDFANQTKEANEALADLKEVYINAAKQFNASGFSEGVKNFYEQMQGITKNISSLNSIYGMEIKDTLEDIKKARKYFNSIDVVATQLNDSVEEVKMTKQQMGLLVQNLSQLNNVYGNMLGAMQGSAR